MAGFDTFADNAKIHFFRVSAPAPGRLLLRRSAGLGLGCGFVGLLLLLAGITLGAFVLFGPDQPNDLRFDPTRRTSGFKMAAFLIFGGVLGLSMLLGTHSILFDGPNRVMERRRLLGFLRSSMPLGRGSVVKLRIYLMPAGFPVCSFVVEPEAGKRFDIGVQLQLTTADALAMAKLAQWIAANFQLDLRVEADANVSPDQLPENELGAFLKANLAE
jgi:hypothetical protein